MNFVFHNVTLFMRLKVCVPCELCYICLKKNFILFSVYNLDVKFCLKYHIQPLFNKLINSFLQLT